MEQPLAKRRRLPAAERRQQIIDAVLEVVSQYGIPGTTIARVANKADIGIGTVYRHFADQKEMLNAAVECMAEPLMALHHERMCEDAIDNFRQLARRRNNMASAENGKFARVWLEFVTANPQIGIQKTMIDLQRRAFEEIKDLVELGVWQGSIRSDVDVTLLAYKMVQQAWGTHMSLLIGMNESLGRDCASEVLEELLSEVAADSDSG